MCGFVGVAARSAISERSWLAAGRDAMAHRGPDDSGEWWSDDGCVGLAHRRLSVIDLTEAGHQPMSSADGSCHIAFNGEIYNFREVRAELESKGMAFQSASDTEVILAAYKQWGTECLQHLAGMFAFALYDSRREAMFLARDRAGEKPLYFSVAEGELRFTSELKGLMADRSFEPRIDPRALDCYLAMGYVPGNLCILEGVNKLPPARALLFDLRTGDIKEWSYWQVPECDTSAIDVEQGARMVEDLESLLENAVAKQLVADVPVGVLLSGGVDSSLVTALAARTNPGIKTFTVRFPGYGGFDETEHARLVASHFNTQHVEVESSETSVDTLPKLARAFDEPVADSSMVPTYLIARLVRQHTKVVLGGDGGDELFGGYRWYNRYLEMSRRFRVIPRSIRRLAGSMAGAVLPVGLRGRNWLQQVATDLDRELPFDGVHFDLRSRRALLRQQAHHPFIAESVWTSRMPTEQDIVQRATRLDFGNYLPEKILAKVDRAGMVNSLEVRAPFLDPDVVGFAFTEVPATLKVAAGQRKILLKQLAARLLPATFDANRKQGFSIPLAAWLERGPWRDFFQEVLTDSSSDTFDRATVTSLLAGQSKGHSNSERLFSLVLFELWRREYGL